MSKRICERCKSTNINKDKYIDDGSDCYVCADCCRVGTAEDFPEYTVFHRITTSPEVLAPHFVYYDQDEYPAVTTIDGKEVELRWRSMICKERYYETEEQAIAATVAKLKEVKQ